MEAVDQHKMAAIQRIVEALNTLETQHAEMRAVEKGLNKYGLVQSRFGLYRGNCKIEGKKPLMINPVAL